MRLLEDPKLSASWKTAMYQEPESGRNGRSDIVWPSVVTGDLLLPSLPPFSCWNLQPQRTMDVDLIGVQLEILDYYKVKDQN